MMTTNLFVIANVKQLRTGESFRILLPFFRASWDVGVLNSVILNSFHNRVEFDTILTAFGISGGGQCVWTPPTNHPPLPQYANVDTQPTANNEKYKDLNTSKYVLTQFQKRKWNPFLNPWAQRLTGRYGMDHGTVSNHDKIE